MSETVLITGANRGIGLALVREYVLRGCQVYGACRHASHELELSGANVIEGIDVSTDEGARLLRERLAGLRLDTLINNAGILSADSLGRLDYEEIVAQLMVNALGPLRVTEALLGKLGRGSKVAMITSRMGSMSDNASGGYYGYRMSKAALNAAGVSLARDLTKRGVAVALLHPGYVQTDMVNHAGDVKPEEAARGLAQRIDALTLENSGGFWHANGERLEW